MKYTVYSAEGQAILVERVQADEIACHTCGASWLYESPVALDGCPYCGDASFVYKSALAEAGGPGSAADVASYGRDLRGIVRALWGGTLDIYQAYDIFQDSVRIYLTRAWHAGMKECGVNPEEMTPEEHIALMEAIVSESSHIFAFLVYVEEHSKAAGYKLAPLLARVELWAYRYPDVQTRAKLMAGGDRKFRWDLGPTKEHCIDCLGLDSKVKRASFWHGHNVRPQSRELACGGFRCLCSLNETDEPVSRGPLPTLSGAGGSILGIR